jgi:hypothetical protein
MSQQTSAYNNATKVDAEIETEQTDVGVFVWRNDDKPGRKLIGFAAVECESALRAELIKRGFGVGAIHQLERFESEEIGR